MSEENLLVPVDVYLKSGVHIGTKFKTRQMENFIYKIRPDGLYVLNMQQIDERLRVVANFMAMYDPKDIIVACRRENGWKPARLFGKYTGIRVHYGRYPPGILTNPQLENFTEAKLVLVADPWPDRNIINDAMKVGIPIIAMCDTNNNVNNIDLVLPCNNKGKKSLGLIFWILAREYMLKRGIIKSEDEFKPTIDDFSEE